MLSYQTHSNEVKELQDQIASGKFYSITFIKKDGSIRYLNGHKKFTEKPSPEDEKRGKWDRLEKNILTVWDRNAPDYKTGKQGAFRSVALDRLLYVKVGDFIRDYTDENQEAIEKYKITPQQLEQVKQKMKISDMVQEEMMGMIQEADFFTINDIPHYLMRMGFDEKSANILKKQAIRAFQKGGDKSVIDWIEKVMGQHVYPVSKGRYSFTPVE